MNNEKPDKKGIKKEAQKLLHSGESKQNVFEILSKEFKYKKIIADVLKNIPSLKAKKKYRLLNLTLLGLLSVTFIIYLILSSSIWMLLYYGALIFIVFRMLIQYYVWVALLSAIGLIGSLAMGAASSIYEPYWPIFIIMVGLNILAFILAIWLEKKLRETPIEIKEKYINKQGENRIRIRYEFKED